MKRLLQLFNTTVLKWATIFTFAFIALYPKLPSVHITRTWVYIRLEDFFICFITLFWVILVIRKKVKLSFPLGWSIIAYWVVGLASLIVSLIFFGPHIAGFFPKIAALQYGRRIEYMILFFVAFSTIRSVKDVWQYVVALCSTVFAFVVYALGQHFYVYFPHIFSHFCFPSFQTGNEEFAKGIPLCLPENARITATFGGHYDLAAYLVVVLPILFAFVFVVKKKLLKVLLSILFILSTVVLILTSSRISFFAALVGISLTLLFTKGKKLILPMWILSAILLVLFSGSLAKRFLQTMRFTSVVTNNQGKVISVVASNISSDIMEKISKGETVIIPNQAVANGDIPPGAAFIVLPQESSPIATSVAIVKNSLPDAEAKKAGLENGGTTISKISGSFLIQKALVYDISSTTRFQGEWPHAWAAFMTFPPLGTGFSTISLATDNDYLRMLGESGFLGFLSFIAIFFVLGVYLKDSEKNTTSNISKTLGFALAGGIIGLLINATLIDVFEASKVAESLWILLGVAVGGLAVSQKKDIHYMNYVKRLLTNNISIGLYLLVSTFIVFGKSINNFFVGDDFTWLRWAASATLHDIQGYFTSAQGFFYRPIAKTVMIGLYTFFSFQPQGYHVFVLLIHWLITLSVYLLAKRIFANKFWSIVVAGIFLVLPSNYENIFWISTLSINMSIAAMLYGLLAFLAFREKNNIFWLFVSVILGLIALFSYELGVVFPLLIIVSDVCIAKKALIKNAKAYIPYIIILAFYAVMRIHSHALPPNGDYSYNISHLLPNSIGNLLGYVGLFLFGESSLTYYNLFRTSLRPYALFVGLFVLLGLLFVAIVLIKKKKYSKWFEEKSRSMWFGIIIALISFIPFIGLGNIAPRYGYLASIGFVIVLGMCIRHIATFLSKKGKQSVYGIGIIVSLIVVFFYIEGITTLMTEWQQASQITFNTLNFFRVYHEDLPQRAHLYVANMPIKKENAWVFPVGFSDALWFIYRDETLTVSTISTQEITALKTDKKTYPYVFQFDANGIISNVQ
jgi:hypothetical protein